MNKFYHFLKIGATAHNFNFKKAYLHTKLDSKIDSFIINKDHTSLSTFIEKGYQLNEKQLYNIMGLYPPLLNQEVIDKMFALYESKYKEKFLKILDLSINSYDDSILQSKSIRKLNQIVEKNENIFSFIFRYGEYKTFFKENNETSNIYKKIRELSSLSNQFSSNFRRETYDSIDHSNEIYGKLGNIISTYSLIEKVILSQVPNIKSYTQEAEANRDRQILNQTVDEFSSLLNKEVKPVKVLQKFEVAQLPRDIQDVVAHINKTYSDIELDMLTIDQKLEVDNMYDKRLPQLLEQYKALKPEFKKTLLENPDTLLVESLDEINKRLHQIFVSNQTDMFNQLKVTHRYLKNN